MKSKKTFQSKYKGYCSLCHYTFWQNEYVKYAVKENGVVHVDCLSSLTDSTPRTVDRNYKMIQGRIDKDKLILALRSEASAKRAKKVRLRRMPGGVTQ